MRWCARCLYPENHPLHLTFDDDGVCSGCRVHEEKDRLDWAERGDRLGRILRDYRSVSGRSYDCIIPVSGARDSYWIVHVVKNLYGMNPLLVGYNRHYNTELGIRNLAYLRTTFDCDFYQLTVSPETVRKITRATLRRRGSMYWHCIAGQTVYPVRMAVQFKVPLIVWGAHQGVDQVGMFSHLDEVEMTRKYRKEHDLMGLEAEDLVDEVDFITESDVAQFRYPDDRELEAVGVRGIYLNNYMRWDSKRQHEDMIRLYGYETAPQTRTFDTYSDVDCYNYSDVHDCIKYLKWGYGKVNDHVAREIRLRRLTAAEGLDRIRSYACRPPRYLPLFLEWIGMTERSFRYVIDQHRSPTAWQRDERRNWGLRHSVMPEVSEAAAAEHALGKSEHCDFVLTQPRRPWPVRDRYVLIGKGHVPGASARSERIAAARL